MVYYAAANRRLLKRRTRRPKRRHHAATELRYVIKSGSNRLRLTEIRTGCLRGGLLLNRGRDLILDICLKAFIHSDMQKCRQKSKLYFVSQERVT